jgi:hypothetical protein
MDKLQPLLVHKFWAMCGVALLMPIAGWWMASGEIAASISTQTTAIKAKEGALPSGGEHPNSSWIKKAGERNKSRLEAQRRQMTFLWSEHLRLLSRWPLSIKDQLANVPYRGPIPVDTRSEYRGIYFTDRDRILKLVNPFDDEDQSGVLGIDWAQNTSPFLPETQWERKPPLSKEMWNVMEDQVLVEQLLKAIAFVNEGAESISDATVRSIEQLTLQGGSRTTKGDSATTAGVQAGATPGGADGAVRPSIFGGNLFGKGGGEGNGGAGSPSRQSAKVDFDLTEEFGSDQEVAKASGAGDSANTATSGNAESPAGGPSGTQRAGRAVRRYIEDEKLPFKTRGFYLKVVMDHRKIPELTTALSNLPFPVRIVRVHWAIVHADDRIANSLEGDAAGGGPAAGPKNRQPGAGAEQGGEGTQFSNVKGAALANPYLARVVIAGILTIYKPSATSDEDDQDAEAETPQEGDDSTADDSADDTPDTPESTDDTTPKKKTPEKNKPEAKTPADPAKPDVPGKADAKATPPKDDTATPATKKDDSKTDTKKPAAGFGSGAD